MQPDAGRGRDRLHELQRGRRTIGVDDHRVEAANDRIAEGEAENGGADEGDADHQEQRDAVAHDPAQLTRGDEDEARRRRAPHCLALGQSA